VRPRLRPVRGGEPDRRPRPDRSRTRSGSLQETRTDLIWPGHRGRRAASRRGGNFDDVPVPASYSLEERR
jgi:hypothetical protein